MIKIQGSSIVISMKEAAYCIINMSKKYHTYILLADELIVHFLFI